MKKFLLFFHHLELIFFSDGLVKRCLDYAAGLEHIMDFTRLRALGSLFSMINQSVRLVFLKKFVKSTFFRENHIQSSFPFFQERLAI